MLVRCVHIASGVSKVQSKSKREGRRLDHMRCGPFRKACDGVKFKPEKR